MGCSVTAGGESHSPAPANPARFGLVACPHPCRTPARRWAMKGESTIPTIPVRIQAAAYAAVGRGPAVAPDFGDAAPPYRVAPDVAAGPAAPPVSAAPMRSLDIRALQHPAEDSRLLLALSASAVVFGFAAMAAYASLGWAVLVEYAAYIAAFGVVFWVSLQIYRSRLLGGAVRVTETTLPELAVGPRRGSHPVELPQAGRRLRHGQGRRRLQHDQRPGYQADQDRGRAGGRPARRRSSRRAQVHDRAAYRPAQGQAPAAAADHARHLGGPLAEVPATLPRSLLPGHGEVR